MQGVYLDLNGFEFLQKELHLKDLLQGDHVIDFEPFIHFNH
jgi:hypothetical protein